MHCISLALSLKKREIYIIIVTSLFLIMFISKPIDMKYSSSIQHERAAS